jgi:hypothetical protein
MTDHPPEKTIPSNLTPEQKKEAERRIAPLTQTLLDVTRLKSDVMNLLVQVGPGAFDPQEIHHLLTTHFEDAKRRFEIDLHMVKRMLAFEALRAAGQLSADGGATNHALQEKLLSMAAITRTLQRQASAQDPPNTDLPGPR